MTQNSLKQRLRAALPEFLKWKLAAIDKAAAALRSVSEGPVAWDEAARLLDQFRSDVRRIGYPQYFYGLHCAARTARAIGADRFTSIEFGVASGNGLVAMEQHAAGVAKHWNISVHVVGFDMSTGLPPRTDPCDCPFAFQGGEFKMDEAKLRARLTSAQLRLGEVADTVRSFTSEDFPPIGFISNDLDLYTSTRDSFHLLDLATDRLLPRVAMYFDDLLGYPYTTTTGEWAAINEFNASHEDRQIGQIYGLKHHVGQTYRFAGWTDLFFQLHVFDHAAYNAPEVMSIPDWSLRS